MDHALPAPPVRVALRVPDGPTAAYLDAAAGAALDVPGIEVVLILATRTTEQRSLRGDRISRRVESAYDWCERRALRGGPAALAERAARSWPAGSVVVRGAAAEQIDALEASRVDVLIDLFPEGGVGSLPVPRAGLWRIRYADDIGGLRLPRLGRPRRTSTGLAESLLSIELASGVVHETGIGVSALRRVGFSRDRDAIYWRSSLLPARRLAQLVAGESVPPGADVAEPSEEGSTSGIPDAGLPPFVGLAKELVRKALDRVLFKSGWIVLVRARRPHGDLPTDLSGFVPIEAPRGRFYADPFVVAAADGTRILRRGLPGRRP